MCMTKKIKFFNLINTDNPELILTVTTKKKDCLEYANMLIKGLHAEHFTAWCNLHNYDSDAQDIWSEYLTSCISHEELDKYRIQITYYTVDNVASIVRMFLGVPPVGLSYETPFEQNYFLDQLRASEIEGINGEQ